MTRRDFLRRASLTAGASVFGALFYANQVEPHWIEYVERSLPVELLPASLEGAALAHLSDLHIGPRVSEGYLREVFAKVAGWQPEIVVLTGDLIENDADVLASSTRLFDAIPRGRLGTFAVLGNHDYGRGCIRYALADELALALNRSGIRVLRNEIDLAGGLQVVGLDDLWARRFDAWTAFRDWKRDQPAIALSHNPDTADLPGWRDYRGWILAGHTHGGQCRAPFLGAPRLPVRNKRYTAGEFPLVDGRRLYISRGVGHNVQVRFNARPEATLFRLARA